MLTRYSIATLLLLIAAAHASAQSQAPLWFDANATPQATAKPPVAGTSPKAANSSSAKPTSASAFPAGSTKPSASQANQQQPPLWFSGIPTDKSWQEQASQPTSSALSWIEANKLETQPTQANLPNPVPATTTPKPSVAPAQSTPPQPSLLPRVSAPSAMSTTMWPVPSEVLGSTVPSNPSAKIAAEQLTPWSSLTEMSKQLPPPTRDLASSPTSADAFIKRAESQLKLLQAQPEQPIAPENSLAKTTAQPLNAAQAASTAAPSAILATPETPKTIAASPAKDGHKISTKLSSRALASGEVEGEFRWPNADKKQLAASELPATPPSQVIAASEESLIPREATSLAFWQDADGKAAGTLSDDADEAEGKSPSDAAKSQGKSDEKFNTNNMIGPMRHAGELFSMLEVQDRFQGYAESVQSARTRDLDSPAQSPYTFETYTYISPVFYHKPLYFEQPNLERYGQGTYRCLQPAASSIHFFGTIPLLPYKALTQHPCEKHYTLGNQRPGNCNPVQKRVVLGQSYFGEVREYWRPGSGY